MTKSDNADAFKIQYNMMKITAAWPEENTTAWYKIRGTLNYSVCLALGVTMLIEAFKDITDFTKLSEILYILITVIAYLFKHGGFFVQRKTFIHMIKLLRDPVFLSYPDDLDVLMVKRIKISQLLTKLFRFLIFSTVFLMSISPFFDKQPLPFPFPYDLGKYRYFMYVFQVIAICTVGWTNPCLDSLTACLIGVAATQLEILAKKIVRVRDKNLSFACKDDEEFSEEMDEMVAKHLKQCVKHHMAIVEFVECIDRVFSFGVLSQFFGSAIIMCNTLFHFVLVSVGSSQFFMLINYLVALSLELFMYCWFGNEVIWKSISVGEACYVFNWYNCGDKVRKYLFIIMERSRRPLRITAFKFSTLSLSAFASIIQWAYSYFALLMKLYRKRST